MQTFMALRMHYKVKLWPSATVLYAPLFLTCIHRLEVFFTYKRNPKNPKNISRKIKKIKQQLKYRRKS